MIYASFNSFYAKDKQVCRHCQFFWCREAGCQTDIAVLWILLIGVGCTGTCQYHTCLLTLLNDLLCTALQCIKGNEIATLRFCPGTYAKTIQFTLKYMEHRLKFRTHDCCMLHHMCFHSLCVFKISYMTQLIDLVITDRLNRHKFFNEVKIGF